LPHPNTVRFDFERLSTQLFKLKEGQHGVGRGEDSSALGHDQAMGNL
jgi:hypothetical protein